MALKQENRLLGLATPLGEDVLDLTGFSGQEEISRLFHYELDMISDDPAIDPAAVVGKNVTFSIELADGSPRCFNGFVSRFFAGDEDGGRRNYRAEVVPWLWFLTLTSDCRIFQEKKVPEIIEQVFGDLGFSDFDLSEVKGDHPKRDYCVQYRETLFDFVSRLMEEEGIFYYFKHEDAKHTLMLADQKGAYFDCGEEEAHYPRERGPRPIIDHLTGWEHGYEFRTGKWSQTDYNFEKHPARNEGTPANLLMTSEPSTVEWDDVDKFEFYDYPGKYPEKDQGAAYTRLRIEEEEVEHDVVNAASTCRTFTPGGKFKIQSHRSSTEEGKRFVVTSIQHTASEPQAYETGGSVDESYSNTFTCIPESVTFRPARTTAKPVVQGLQPAVVTGPAGEEIWPDKYARVKLQFFWDREGQRDENTSCWVRVSQDYAGKGWGSMCIPRIGQEVLVAFLEGDPDRPVVTGRVYNDDQMPPFGLPGSKAVSGLKSNSTPGGGGYNEISADDTKGKEKVTIHGQYDMNTTVEHDQTTTVHNNRTDTIDVDDSETVGANQTINIGADQSITVGANQTLSIGADQTTSINANQTLSVAADQTQNVGANRAVSVAASDSVEVGADRSVNVSADLSMDAGANVAVSSGANTDVTAGANISISASGTITISAGGSSIEIGASGIKIISPAIVDIKGALIKQNA
ncbi:MAG: type VI secretion system Vgr family protein [Planctomycetota bacterium]|jgi:type VI secretion system secreted protein VgrG